MEQLEKELYDFVKEAINACKQQNVGRLGLAAFLNQYSIYFGEVVIKAPKENEVLSESLYVKTYHNDGEKLHHFYFRIADLEDISEQEAWDLVQRGGIK